MKTYSEFRPTGLDGIEDWLVLPVTQNRDSDVLTRANWQSAVDQLNALDTSDDWDIHRFGHWGCGWFEIIVVKPETKAYELAEEIEAALENYAVLDDELLANMEMEEHYNNWNSWACREFTDGLMCYLVELLSHYVDDDGELYDATDFNVEKVENIRRFAEIIDASSKDELYNNYRSTDPDFPDFDIQEAVKKFDYDVMLKQWPNPDPLPIHDSRQMEI